MIYTEASVYSLNCDVFIFTLIVLNLLRHMQTNTKQELIIDVLKLEYRFFFLVR